jgi:hypothetical protein
MTEPSVRTVLRPPKGWLVRLAFRRAHGVRGLHHGSDQIRRRWLRCVDDALEFGGQGLGLLGLVRTAIAECVGGVVADLDEVCRNS